jgi:hypothetical protein
MPFFPGQDVGQARNGRDVQESIIKSRGDTCQEIMSKLKDFFKSGHIHVALATGASIILLAFFSKRVLSEPIGNLSRSGPPFLMVIYESLTSIKKYKSKKWMKSIYWVLAILIATATVILVHWKKGIQ